MIPLSISFLSAINLPFSGVQDLDSSPFRFLKLMDVSLPQQKEDRPKACNTKVQIEANETKKIFFSVVSQETLSD